VTLGRSAALTDAGRRRRRNEDSFVCAPPLFAVADGMGGALAGELASRLAVTALEEAGRAAGPVDLVAAILEGNKRINERSIADPATAGMGTTVTAALVGATTVSIGHVGDSRAYRLRGDSFEQLTPDHSLVAELVRTGQITPAEAEDHPQRAVITRALGTDARVEVDTFEVATEPGDLYLLCSDGLSGMVDDRTLAKILGRQHDDLQATARALIAAANAAGGEDNITCVLFEIVAGGAAGEDTAIIAADPGAETGVISVADEDTFDRLDVSGEQTMILAAPTEAAGWARPAPEAATPPAAPAPVTRTATHGPAAEPTRHRRRRKLPYVIALLVLIALAAAAGLALLSKAHFVGADGRGRLVVYQGVPWDITGSVKLYRAVYVSPVLAAQLSQTERIRLFDHGLHSKAVSLAAVRAYEHELLR
jgi:protein phosphatase